MDPQPRQKLMLSQIPLEEGDSVMGFLEMRVGILRANRRVGPLLLFKIPQDQWPSRQGLLDNAINKWTA